MDFGKWILVAFIGFGLFIGTLIVICMRQDINLVSRDYYREELDYQRQIERILNTSQLPQKPLIRVSNNNTVHVEFNPQMKVERGELILFRPSDERLDQRFALKPTENGEQQFILNLPQQGMYRAKLLWTMEGKEFYYETIINL